MELVVIAALVAVVAVVASTTFRVRADDRLFTLAKTLGGHVTSRNSIVGKCGRVDIGYRLVSTGAGSATEQWTEVTAALPDGFPLAIYLRRQGWLDRSKIEAGELIDVVVGDAAFDARFLVEAAPAEVVKQLLDGEARRFLMKAGDLTLVTQDTPAGRRLALQVRGWIEDPDRAAALVEQVARLARRVPEVFEEVTGEAPIELAGAPFREMPVQRENPHTPARQREEVLRLEMQRADRRTQQGAMLAVAVGAIVFVIVATIAAMR